MFARSQKTCMRDMCILRDLWLMANNYALLRCLQARVMTNNNLEYFEMLMTNNNLGYLVSSCLGTIFELFGVIFELFGTCVELFGDLFELFGGNFELFGVMYELFGVIFELFGICFELFGYVFELFGCPSSHLFSNSRAIIETSESHWRPIIEY